MRCASISGFRRAVPVTRTKGANVSLVNGISGAEAVVASLVEAGVEVCFMNPGTSELPFLRAMDDFPQMTGVPALFEGVATGAADGYARITGRPAAVLLHMGSGLSNGLANLHNARRAHTPLLCLVGSHATHHVAHDAPLQSDIETAAHTVSGWVRTADTAKTVAADAMDALDATQMNGGQVATLIVPANVAWNPSALPFSPRKPYRPQEVDHGVLGKAIDAFQDGEPTTVLLGGRALSEAGLRAADRISQATGAQLLTETFPARAEQGAGLPFAQRLAYDPGQARSQLAQTRNLILAGARPPVSFFAYPGKKGELTPQDCRVIDLGDPGQDIVGALEIVADKFADGIRPRLMPHAGQTGKEDSLSMLPGAGELSVQTMAHAVAATLPANSVVVEEAISSTAAFAPALAGAAPHTLMTLTGGALGQGLPLATGAAIAAPERSVLALEADGSALFTIQALWTQARERLNVTTVIINNASYKILRTELPRFGGLRAGTKAIRLLDLTDPTIDFVALSEGLGVPARRVTTNQQFIEALHQAYAAKGPHLIEAVVT